MSHINQILSRKPGTLFRQSNVCMNFGAWTTRAGISHFPEIILFVAAQNSLFRQQLLPAIIRLLIKRNILTGISFKYSDIQMLRIQLINPGEQFPCPLNGFFLKVIAKTPIAKHFKHGMVISIYPHLFKIVVLS